VFALQTIGSVYPRDIIALAAAVCKNNYNTPNMQTESNCGVCKITHLPHTVELGCDTVMV